MHRSLFTTSVLALATGLVLTDVAYAQCELGQFSSLDFGVAAGSSAGGLFGSVVVADGSVLAIGAPGQDGGAGAVFVYRHDGSGFQPEQAIASPLASPGPFGEQVVLDGDRIVVPSLGTVEEYVFDGVQWIHLGPTGVPPTGRFALDGDVLARGDRSFGDGQGIAEVYRLGPSGWTLEQTLSNPLAGSVDMYGADVALEGDVLAVGAGDDEFFFSIEEFGAAHVYRDGPTGWVLEDTVQPPVVEANTGFGFRLALSGDVLAVSEPFADTEGPFGTVTDTGAIHLFRFDGAGTWAAEAELQSSPLLPVERIGRSLDLDGDLLGVSKGSGFTEASSVVVFRRVGGGWIQQPAPLPTDLGPASGFGTDVAVVADVLVAGAPEKDAEFVDVAGSTYAFSVRWIQNIGGGFPDSTGHQSELILSGSFCPGEFIVWKLDCLPFNATALLVVGFSTLEIPIGGGIFHPALDLVVSQSVTLSPTAKLFLPEAGWPVSAFGLKTTWQAIVIDPDSPLGFVLSDAIQL